MNHSFQPSDTGEETSIPMVNVYDRQMMRRRESNQSLKSMASHRSGRSTRSNRSARSNLSTLSTRSNRSFQHGQMNECDGSMQLRAIVDERVYQRNTGSDRSSRSQARNSDGDDGVSRRSRILQTRKDEHAVSHLPSRFQVQTKEADPDRDDVSVLSEGSSSSLDDSVPSNRHKIKYTLPSKNGISADINLNLDKMHLNSEPQYKRFVKPSAAHTTMKSTEGQQPKPPFHAKPVPSASQMADFIAILEPETTTSVGLTVEMTVQQMRSGQKKPQFHQISSALIPSASKSPEWVEDENADAGEDSWDHSSSSRSSYSEESAMDPHSPGKRSTLIMDHDDVCSVDSESSSEESEGGLLLEELQDRDLLLMKLHDDGFLQQDEESSKDDSSHSDLSGKGSNMD